MKLTNNLSSSCLSSSQQISLQPSSHSSLNTLTVYSINPDKLTKSQKMMRDSTNTVIISNPLIQYSCSHCRKLLSVYLYSYFNRQTYNNCLVKTNLALLASDVNNEDVSQYSAKKFKSATEEIRDILKSMGSSVIEVGVNKVKKSVNKEKGQGTSQGKDKGLNKEADQERVQAFDLSFIDHYINRVDGVNEFSSVNNVCNVSNVNNVCNVNDNDKECDIKSDTKSDTKNEIKCGIYRLNTVRPLIRYKLKKDNIKNNTTLEYYFDPVELDVTYGYTLFDVKDLLKLKNEKYNKLIKSYDLINLYIYMKMKIECSEYSNKDVFDGVNSIAGKLKIGNRSVINGLNILCDELHLINRKSVRKSDYCR